MQLFKQRGGIQFADLEKNRELFEKDSHNGQTICMSCYRTNHILPDCYDLQRRLTKKANSVAGIGKDKKKMLNFLRNAGMSEEQIAEFPFERGSA